MSQIPSKYDADDATEQQLLRRRVKDSAVEAFEEP